LLLLNVHLFDILPAISLGKVRFFLDSGTLYIMTNMMRPADWLEPRISWLCVQRWFVSMGFPIPLGIFPLHLHSVHAAVHELAKFQRFTRW